jgi:hypothetical protein
LENKSCDEFHKTGRGYRYNSGKAWLLTRTCLFKNTVCNLFLSWILLKSLKCQIIKNSIYFTFKIFSTLFDALYIFWQVYFWLYFCRLLKFPDCA